MNETEVAKVAHYVPNPHVGKLFKSSASSYSDPKQNKTYHFIWPQSQNERESPSEPSVAPERAPISCGERVNSNDSVEENYGMQENPDSEIFLERDDVSLVSKNIYL